MKDKNINEIKRLNLIRILKEKDIKPIRLAEMIKVERSYISALMKGSSNLGKNTIEKLCKALGIEESEFFSYDKLKNEVHEKQESYKIREGGDNGPMSKEDTAKILSEILEINKRLLDINETLNRDRIRNEEKFAAIENRMDKFERALKENGLSVQEREPNTRKNSAS